MGESEDKGPKFGRLLTFPKSSNLAHGRYAPNEKVLEIRFQSGGVYHYTDVPLSSWRGLRRAASAGRYLNRNIKPEYEFRKISTALPPIRRSEYLRNLAHDAVHLLNPFEDSFRNAPFKARWVRARQELERSGRRRTLSEYLGVDRVTRDYEKELRLRRALGQLNLWERAADAVVAPVEAALAAGPIPFGF